MKNFRLPGFITRKATRFLGVLAAAALITVSGSSRAMAAELPADYPAGEPLQVRGTIYREGEQLILRNMQGDFVQEEIVLNISDDTRILDAVNGFPVTADSLRDGEMIYAYISQAMTLSLPPQSHAELIICQIPADFAVPSYETVKELTKSENGAWQLTTVRGGIYRIDSSSVVLPYLTRNIITAEDLTPGYTALIWPAKTDENGIVTASRIVRFSNIRGEKKPSGPASDPALVNAFSESSDGHRNLSLSEVMDRILLNQEFENALDYIDDAKPEAEDALVLLCTSESGKYKAYGCISPEYGMNGILLNNVIDGQDNYNFLEEVWSYDRVRPTLEEQNEYDVLFSFTQPDSKTGNERKIYFNTYDTGTMSVKE